MAEEPRAFLALRLRIFPLDDAFMPELPEAETIARQLNLRIGGATFDWVSVTRRDVIHGDPRPLTKLLPGRVIRRVHRQAKRVVFDLGAHMDLVFHLGMSGRLTLHPPEEPRRKHTHLRMRFRDSNVELRFCDPRRFGGVWCLTENGRHKGRTLGPLGVEPLETRPAAFRRLLNRQRQIKALLLDQRVIAGMGNIYCDEALHTSAIHPLTRAAGLSSTQAGRLLRAIKSTLNRAIRFNGSTLADYRQPDGSSGSFQRMHRVYHREGKPCKKCRTPIVRIIAAGRSSFFCLCCQPIS